MRIAEAADLLASGKWHGAYYLAGYAVECALKACIAKLTSQHDFPPEKNFVHDCYTHDLTTLQKAAGLKTAFDTDTAVNSTLWDNWLVVKDWNERSRYVRHSEVKARTLYAAITDAANGVLPWIKVRW